MLHRAVVVDQSVGVVVEFHELETDGGAPALVPGGCELVMVMQWMGLWCSNCLGSEMAI